MKLDRVSIDNKLDIPIKLKWEVIDGYLDHQLTSIIPTEIKIEVYPTEKENRSESNYVGIGNGYSIHSGISFLDDHYDEKVKSFSKKEKYLLELEKAVKLYATDVMKKTSTVRKIKDPLIKELVRLSYLIGE